jgi:hypothetical protein
LYLLPRKKDINLLRNELDRLEKFGQQREHCSSTKDVPEYELESLWLWEYYDALHNAICYVLERNDTLVDDDDVWSKSKDDSWWV